MVYHHFIKFGGHRYCSSRDIMFLVCHVIKQDPIIKGSGDYYDRRPVKVSNIPPSLVAMDTRVLQI